MTKKRLTWRQVLLRVGIVLSVLFPISLIIYNPFQVVEYINKYSNDSNYNNYSGIIKNVDIKNIITFESIVDDSGEIIDLEKGLRYVAFASEKSALFQQLSLETGSEISFTAAKYVLPGGILPIVQIDSYEGKEILHFEEGKTALLKHCRGGFYFW